jgi:ABC-type glycerol-3-phosphate transport system permease component
MTTATEATRTVVRPISRSRRLRKSPLGRILFKTPFYLLIAVIFVYALFPFYWVVRSSFTPEVNLFQTPVKYLPAHPTLDNDREVLSASFFQHAMINSAIGRDR